MGKLDGGRIVFASETCALDCVGATFVRDIEPGEIVVVDKNGVHSDKSHVGKCPKTQMCIRDRFPTAMPPRLSHADAASPSANPIPQRRSGTCTLKMRPARDWRT